MMTRCESACGILLAIYYALHDVVFPSVNSSSLFLFVYSPLLHCHDPTNKTGQFQHKDRHDFEMECTYWLKFIASNSRLGPERPSKPVVFVDIMSHVDDILEVEMKKHELIEGSNKLKRDFQQYIDVQGAKPLFLDARSTKDVSKVLLCVPESFVLPST